MATVVIKRDSRKRRARTFMSAGTARPYAAGAAMPSGSIVGPGRISSTARRITVGAEVQMQLPVGAVQSSTVCAEQHPPQNHVAHVTPGVAKPTLAQELRAIDSMSKQDMQDRGWMGEAHVEEYNMPQHNDDCHYV